MPKSTKGKIIMALFILGVMAITFRVPRLRSAVTGA